MCNIPTGPTSRRSSCWASWPVVSEPGPSLQSWCGGRSRRRSPMKRPKNEYGEWSPSMKFLPITEERPVSDAIITALAEGGVRYVLGMPGGLTGPLWRSLHNHPIIRAIQVREESIGALMAEAYGRFTGQPAVVMGQGEWIAGNAGQGYMEAV